MVGKDELRGAAATKAKLQLRIQASFWPEAVLSHPPKEEDCLDRSEVWDRLQMLLPSQREQRLAYLLYHCGLGPAEIVQLCPQEWSNIQEITRLRRTILERLLNHADLLHSWLNDSEFTNVIRR